MTIMPTDLENVQRPHAAPVPRPWYRQFWPWFLIAIPAWGVASSIITTSVALYGADEVVSRDSVRALSRTSWQQIGTSAPSELPAALEPLHVFDEQSPP
jgi:hypothetical protein